MPDTYTPQAGEFHVNTYTTNDQLTPAVTGLADGGYVIVWHSWNQDGDQLGVFAQAFNADGTARGAEFQVNIDTVHQQAYPAIDALPDGGYVITWHDVEYGQGIHAQIFNSDGTRRGPEIDVKATGFGENEPSVAVLAGGGFVVTWWNGSDGSAGGIGSRAFNSDGTPRGGEVLVNTTTANSQLYPDIAALADGGYVITWQSALQDGSGIGIYAQAYNANGTLRGGEFRVNTYTASDQTAPEVDALADGGYVICWQSSGQDGAGAGIYAQAYNANGTARGTEFRVNTTTALEQVRPDVTGLADGRYLISWESDLQDGSGRGIYAQAYGANGTPDGGEFLVNSYTGSEQRQSAVAGLPSGGFVVSWTSNGQEGNYGIYARAYRLTVTSGPDVITGTEGYDDIDALGGNDTIYALGGNDQIDGGSGADTMEGGIGDDTYYVDDSGDMVTELVGEGTDTVSVVGSLSSYTLTANVENLLYDGSGDFSGTGNALDNYIEGGWGNDTIDGGAGADYMSGLLWDDTYIVDNVDDWVDEGYDESSELNYFGVDTVLSSVSYWLPSNIEILTLTGTASINATGNEIFNRLNGNSGNNVLDGGPSDDVMTGGAGDDTYVVDDVGDQTIELPGEGTDQVNSAVTRTLGANLENLTLTGSATIDGTGNAAANSLTGNSAANVLSGLEGNDTISGLAGNDFIDGGDGLDTASYSTAASGVTVSLLLAGAQATGGDGVDTLTNIENLTGSAFADRLTGNALVNVLSGLAGNDILDGGTGADAMQGGSGNDTYIVDDIGDVVTEDSSAGGTDRVKSSVSFTLGANFEDLILLGSAAINGTGNGLANVLTGNDGNNVLNGGTGADTMRGALGNDTYIVDNVGDVVSEASSTGGTDRVRSSVNFTLGANIEDLILVGSAITGTGNDLANVLTGNDGNNVLNGGTGADTMRGALGDDTYIVDNLGDVVTEGLSTGGTDRVKSSVNFTLGANLEDLILLGSVAINGTGNELANTLTGNTGNNILNGGAGADTMRGDLGDDTYIVDNVADRVIEGSAAGGTDLVQSSVTFTLGSNLENVTLLGTNAINGTGNDLGNSITGNSAGNVLSGGGGADTINGGTGSDRLYGGIGNDSLTGDAGADRFYFNSAPGASNFDTIQDFSAVDDSIYLDRAIYSGIAFNGTLAADAFRLGTSAADADDRIIYDQATGNLYYDADGNGAGAQLLFAQLIAGAPITNADFIAISTGAAALAFTAETAPSLAAANYVPSFEADIEGADSPELVTLFTAQKYWLQIGQMPQSPFEWSASDHLIG